MASKNFSSKLKQYKYLFVSFLLLLAITSSIAFIIPSKNRFELAKEEVVLRKIGHEILLSSGDSVSRILPIKKIASNEFQIRFENEFSFKTDSVVKIIRKTLEKNGVSTNYIVNVLRCSTDEVVYSYMISQTKKDDIVTCSGRKQPKACYLIALRFEDQIKARRNGYVLGGLGLLTSCGLLLTFVAINTKMPKKELIGTTYRFGNTLFDVNQRNITFGDHTVSLTSKESKILLIFAKAPNTIVERNQLQKEIWEDEGVIVGRSLDMFVSKLRRKLENDPSIQLRNIHGKGYKLEVH